MKSSNGTFINSERLSAEGVESEPFELKTDDIVVGHNIAAQERLNVNVTLRNLVLILLGKITRPSSITKLRLGSFVFSRSRMHKQQRGRRRSKIHRRTAPLAGKGQASLVGPTGSALLAQAQVAAMECPVKLNEEQQCSLKD